MGPTVFSGYKSLDSTNIKESSKATHKTFTVITTDGAVAVLSVEGIGNLSNVQELIFLKLVSQTLLINS